MFCPYNTPLLFVKNTPCSLALQWVARVGPFITGSYADSHKTPLLIAVSRELRLWVEDCQRTAIGQKRKFGIEITPP